MCKLYKYNCLFQWICSNKPTICSKIIKVDLFDIFLNCLEGEL